MNFKYTHGLAFVFDPSSVHIFQTSSPLKPLSKSKPNFMWTHFGNGKKVCLWHLGHMTKMTAMSVYGKTPSKIFFSGTSGTISMKLGK